MASNYPGSLDSFDTIASDKKTSDSVGGRTHRQMHNDLGDAIEAVQAELGTTPSGSYDTVKARFEAIEGSTLPQVDAKGDLIVGTADNTYDNLAAGTNDTVLVADSGQAKGVKWAQVPTDGIADNAVTSAKIAAGTIVAADIANDTITATQIAANAVGSSELADNAVDTAAIADGAVTAAKILIGAATVGSGTGTPEGVVTAAPGSTWLQTDSTTDVKGWLKWIKATGTGNTGWVAGPEADTGWRKIGGGDLVNGWAASASFFYLRRIGSQVSLLIYADGTSASASTFYTLPASFRPNIVHVGAGVASASKQALLEVQSGGTCLLYFYDASTFYTASTWFTNAAWPTSLPGSAA